jgi:hypothetical protein
VFETRVLRGVFVPKGDEVIGDRRRPYNEDLHTKYYSGDQIKKQWRGGECSTD